VIFTDPLKFTFFITLTTSATKVIFTDAVKFFRRFIKFSANGFWTPPSVYFFIEAFTSAPE